MDLKSQIESILFVSAKPVAIKELASATGAPVEDVEREGDALVGEYADASRGMVVIRDGSRLQMVSSPDNAGAVRAFLKDETTGDLSRPSLETLTIIAYRGPISKIDLDRIRGVNCSLILRNLMMRGLVEASENGETRDACYSVSLDFIRFLGIRSLHELPDYERLSKSEDAAGALPAVEITISG